MTVDGKPYMPSADLVRKPVALFLEYNDGFRATILMLGGMVTEVDERGPIPHRAQEVSALEIPMGEARAMQPPDEVARTGELPKRSIRRPDGTRRPRVGAQVRLARRQRAARRKNLLHALERAHRTA